MGWRPSGAGISDWEKNFDPAQNARLDLEQVHVIEEDGEARASTTVLPLESLWRASGDRWAASLRSWSIPPTGGGATRGKLMRAVLRDMRERGVSLSLLAPFAHAFYRIFGYELATEAIEYRLKPADLPTSPEQSHLRAYQEEDLSSLMDLYEAEAKGHTLSVRRSEGHWKTSLSKKDADVAVYERDGDVEGYILYKISGWQDRDPRRTLSVEEIVAATPRAREALLSFMAGLDPLVYGIKLFTPRGEPLHPYLRSSHVDAKIEPDQMLRLVDVEGALGYLERTPGAPLVLDVSDDVIPENSGEYTVAEAKLSVGRRRRRASRSTYASSPSSTPGTFRYRDLARHGLIRGELSRSSRSPGGALPPGRPVALWAGSFLISISASHLVDRGMFGAANVSPAVN